MKKLLLSLAAGAIAITASAGEVVFDFTAANAAELYGLPAYTFNELTQQGDADYVPVPKVITSGDVTITLNSEVDDQGNTGWRLWSDGLREYNKRNPYFTVTTTNGEKVTHVSWTSNSASFALEGSTENIAGWSGSQESVTFVNTTTSNKAVYTITVGYGDYYEDVPTIPTPSKDVIDVAEALELIAGEYRGEATVKGFIISITEVSTQYGNATYVIADSKDATSGLTIYRGKYLDNASFTSEDQLEVGAKVIVKGDLTLYNSTPEMVSGNILLSYEAPSNDDTPSVSISNNIKDLAVGDFLKATAVVTAQNTRGLILTDNGGSILYYNPSVDLSLYPIGTVVNVEGEVSVYNKGLQLTDASNLEVVGSEKYNYPMPTVYTAAMLDEAAAMEDNFQATYVSLEGVLNISGNYYNIVVEDTKVQGSIYYATDEIKNQLQNGNTYNFTGYYVALSGTSTKYFNIVVTEIELIEESGNEGPEAPEGIITVAEAIQLIKDGYSSTATVKGVISEIQEISVSYGNATYFIKDNLDDEESLEIFRGYYLEGEKFTSENQLQVGATVVVEGTLTLFGETPEINTGSKILEYTIPSDGITSIEKDINEVEYYNLQGVRVNNPVKGDIYIIRQGNKTSKAVIR